jgi:hypothetical protein
MRHAGMHWPTMEERPNRQAITSLPGVQNGVLVILADSARFHYDDIRREAPNCLDVWRALPRPDRLPAHLGWDPEAVADECVNLWDEQPHGGVEWFTPLNELQFDFESGEVFPGFGVTAERLRLLRRALRRRFDGLDVRLVFPAWGPDQPSGVDSPFAAADEWLSEAMDWDAIGMHVYSHDDGNAEHRGARNVVRTHEVMRGLLTDRFGEAGRTKPIIYTEMNANRDAAVSDRDMLNAAARVCASDPSCLGYAYYIWETRREHETVFNVFGNPERMALFQDPPAVDAPPPAPSRTDLSAVRGELRRIADDPDLTPSQMRQQLQSLIERIQA